MMIKMMTMMMLCYINVRLKVGR